MTSFWLGDELEGRFFMPWRLAQEGTQMTKWRIKKPVVAAFTILASLSGGCAVDHSTQRQVAEALQQKDEASIRLAKAITNFCSAHHASPDARQACIVEQRLILLPKEEPPASLSPMPLTGNPLGDQAHLFSSRPGRGSLSNTQ